MSEIDLKAMRARAMAATPGPWRAGAVQRGSVFAAYAESLGGPSGERNLLRLNPHFPNEADAAHIAGLDPQTVIALLDRLERTERDAARMRKALEYMRDNYDHEEYAHKYGTACRTCDAEKAIQP